MVAEVARSRSFTGLKPSSLGERESSRTAALSSSSAAHGRKAVAAIGVWGHLPYPAPLAIVGPSEFGATWGMWTVASWDARD